MKKSHYKVIALGAMVFLTAAYSCKNALNKPSVNVLPSNILPNKAGVDGLLIGAYSLLDGYYQGQPLTNYGSGISNWSFGSVGADDAYKGSTSDDQGPDAPELANHSLNANNAYVASKWQVSYAGVQRANNVIQEVALVTDGSEAGTIGQNAIAEARFLRGVYHFELAKIWRNVPYVDETVTYTANNYNVPNINSGGQLTPIWDKIEADFAFAMTILPKTQPQAGRANYYAAEAFLAKAYMYDHQYDKALPLLTDLINNGTTASGVKYALGPYENNFNATTKNGSESVFAAQMTVNDGSNGQNDDAGDVLNFPGGGTYTNCCGFFQPSYHLANSFKVDGNGLPMFQTDPATGFPMYDDVNLKNDHGYAKNKAGVYTLGGSDSGPAFVATTEAVDPRLDWTVGRRDIPYLDWGLCGGESWTRGDLGPYNPIKNVFYHSAQASTSDNYAGWATNQGTANNYNIIRFAYIYLWRAECEVEAGNLTAAEADVNMIRNRMAQHQEYWVHTYVDNTDPSKGFTSTPAANYKISPYNGQFVANGQAYARAAVYMEEQLEFGMEGQRFFDLQRHDGRFGGPAGTGYMAGVVNAFIKADTRINNPVLNGHSFTAGKNELYPIPQAQIDIEAGKLKQNPGY